AYMDHSFVRQIGDGTLPAAAFRRYLQQDYLFLRHFARAYGLAVFKSETLEDMRSAAGGLTAIVDLEMGLHVAYCAKWGVSEGELATLPEANATLAYTRYVLERGVSGDLLDLHTALAPCVIGYAEIGSRLARQKPKVESNPYGDWIAMYAGPEFQELAQAAGAQLDSLFERYGGPARFSRLSETFRTATRLESDFWQMGLDAGLK